LNTEPQSFFDSSVFAVDYLDAISPDEVKIPRFQTTDQECPKDLKSSVIFPEFSFKPSDHKGKAYIIVTDTEL